MADNVDITPGSGATIAADEISSVKYQRVKLTLGADGTASSDLVGDASGAYVQGPAASSAGVAGNPIRNGGRASAAVPSGVDADGDVVDLWLSRLGALFAALPPHLGMVGDPYTLTSKTAQYTSQQTTAAFWTPGSGKKLVITSYQIQAGGTTTGTLQLYFAAASTAYSRGTTPAIFDGEFAPSATLKPGVVQTGLWIASTADHKLHVTDSAAISPLTITVWGYEV